MRGCPGEEDGDSFDDDDDADDPVVLVSSSEEEAEHEDRPELFVAAWSSVWLSCSSSCSAVSILGAHVVAAWSPVCLSCSSSCSAVSILGGQSNSCR